MATTKRDRGWAWVVLASTCVCQFLISGPLYGAGILAVTLKDTYDVSLAMISLPGALLGSLISLLGPLSSFIMCKIGWRASTILGGVLCFLGLMLTSFSANIWHVVVGLGIICGTGEGILYTPIYVVVGHYFEKKITFAVGLSNASVGLGVAVFPLLFECLVGYYGWRGAVLVLAGLSLNICVAGALLRPIKSKVSTDTTSPGKGGGYMSELRDVMKMGTFYCLNITIFCIGAGNSAVHLHLPNYTVVKGGTVSEAGHLVIFIGFAIVIGRFAIPLIFERLSVRHLWTLFSCLLLAGVATLLLPLYIGSYIGNISFSIIFGLLAMIYPALYSLLIMEYMGLRYLGTVHGINMFCYGVASASMPSAVGALADMTGIYDYSFYTAGACLLVSALSLCPIHFLKARQDIKEYTENSKVIEEKTL